MEKILELLTWLPLFVVSISFHEAAHAYTAYYFGDDTAKQQGRLTLNPLAHLDVFGTLMLVLVHFGWAKPVPVDPRKLRNARWQMPVISAAGPLANLILAIVSLMGYILIEKHLISLRSTLDTFAIAAQLNVMLFVFNLIPIPPLDGAGVLRAFLPQSQQKWFDQIGMYGAMILMLMLFIIPGTSEILTSAIRFVLKNLYYMLQWI